MRNRVYDPTMTDAEYERRLKKEYPKPIPRRKERIDVDDLLITISLFAVFPAAMAMFFALLFSFRVSFIILAGIMAWTAYLSFRRKEIMFVRWTVRWDESPMLYVFHMFFFLMTMGLVLAMAYMIGNDGLVY